MGIPLSQCPHIGNWTHMPWGEFDNSIPSIVEGKDFKITLTVSYPINQGESHEIYRLQAKVVAKDYHRMKGIDFEESFTQIVSIKVIRMCLTNATSQNWTVYQMGVLITFLNEELHEAVHVS